MSASSLESYCRDADGELRPGELSWFEEHLTQVCLVGYGDRERNPYTNLWGIAFFDDPQKCEVWASSESTADKTVPWISVELVAGSFAQLREIDSSVLKDQHPLSEFHRRTTSKLVPARFDWQSGQQIACLLDHSGVGPHSYDAVKELVIHPNPGHEQDGLAYEETGEPSEHPHIHISAGDSFQKVVQVDQP